MKLVDDFEQAVREHEMMGAQHPSEHHAIELRYQLTKERLISALRRKQETEQMK